MGRAVKHEARRVGERKLQPRADGGAWMHRAEHGSGFGMPCSVCGSHIYAHHAICGTHLSYMHVDSKEGSQGSENEDLMCGAYADMAYGADMM